jgi:cell division protein ZapA
LIVWVYLLSAERMLIVVTAKNKVVVRVSGKEYTIVGIESEEYIQKVGLYIDRKMNEITRVNNKLSTSMVAVLTAMNVADDFLKCHESEVGLQKELKKTYEEFHNLKEEKRRLVEENAALSSKNSGLQLELAKREAELREVRNSLEKASHTKP